MRVGLYCCSAVPHPAAWTQHLRSAMPHRADLTLNSTLLCPPCLLLQCQCCGHVGSWGVAAARVVSVLFGVTLSVLVCNTVSVFCSTKLRVAPCLASSAHQHRTLVRPSVCSQKGWGRHFPNPILHAMQLRRLWHSGGSCQRYLLICQLQAQGMVMSLHKPFMS